MDLSEKNNRLNKGIESVHQMQDELRQRLEEVRVRENHSRALETELDKRRTAVVQAEQRTRNIRTSLLREAFRASLAEQEYEQTPPEKNR